MNVKGIMIHESPGRSRIMKDKMMSVPNSDEDIQTAEDHTNDGRK